MPGRCDIRVLTYVINTHLRRHDTYHSWFELTDANQIRRHTFSDPADIRCVPIEHGEMTAETWREHILATPSPLQWDCFRFAVIQRADSFTFCAAIDHLYIDAQFAGALRAEFYLMYTALLAGKAPVSLPAAGSYKDYSIRQHEYTSGLTLDSPPIRSWVDFFEQNGGTLPECPVSLGDGSGSCDLIVAPVMDDYGLIAHDTRGTLAEFMTIGWFTGFVPVTIPVDASSFDDTARAAQESFDSGKHLANVPFNRVLELAPWLTMPHQRVPLLFHLDTSSPLLSTIVNADINVSSMKLYHDGRVPARFDLRINRYENETHVAVFFPNNPIARESVTRYIATLQSIYARVAEGRGGAASLRSGTQFQRLLV
jgi:hypothetical protein